MNDKPKGDEKNLDRNKDLEQYIDIFKIISSEADILIENNCYDAIQFYAIILCYLNYYDYSYFLTILHTLFVDEEKCKVLYEILLIYFSYFLNPINQDFDFFDKFIDYCASNKEFNSFENGLNYIRDIETFISVINITKDKIVDKYATPKGSFRPIILNDDLEIIKKQKNKEMETIIPAIKSIKDYSKEKKVLLVYFTSSFWIKLLREYNIPDYVNIKYCYKLREIFF